MEGKKMTKTSDDTSGPSLSRRSLIAGSAAVGVATAVGLLASAESAHAAAPAATAGRPRKFRNSLSVSPFTEAVLSATVLEGPRRSASTLAGVQRIFDQAGATEMYARVATVDEATNNTGGGATRAIERARLAKSLGLPFNPELGLWAYYGDIALQPSPDFRDYPDIVLPGPWVSLTIDQMADAMRKYGRAVARQILSTGVDVNVWDLGNEIEFGLAGVAIASFSTSDSHGWTYQSPDAVNPAIGTKTVYDMFAMTESDRNNWLAANLWPYVGKLLVAVADGIRSVDRHARFATHTSVVALQLPGLLPAFWSAMEQAGFSSEVLGSSYYPTSSAGSVDQLQALKATAAALTSSFGRPMFLAETAYPSAVITSPQYATWNTPVPGYPLTPQGQYEFFRDLARWGNASGCLSGIRLWAPDYCTAEWAEMSCFNSPVNGNATAKPVLGAVSAGLRS
jgi:arabinogalactan endo-1,4-beta-galactosidase